MQRDESLSDEMMGTVTYRIGDGRYLTVSVDDVRRHGLTAVLQMYGVEIPTERVPVYLDDGRKIGSVPALFDPLNICSHSFLYEPRPNDFRRVGDRWIASRTLGPGDLSAIDGFVWDRSEPPTPKCD